MIRLLEEITVLRLPLVLILTLTSASAIANADPIEGRWATADNTVANISACADSFCILLKTGDYAGKEIGKLKFISEGKYSGEIMDPDDQKHYTGRAALKGKELKLSGCALKIFCRTEIWHRILQ
jgi:uncharacterized protein (DUF2147 family)